MRHTPGPWRAAGPHDVNGEPVAYIYQEQEGQSHALAIVRMDSKTSPEANARLIAAAPELLEVAQNALAFLSVSSETGEYKDHLSQRLEQAIAKAEGKEVVTWRE